MLSSSLYFELCQFSDFHSGHFFNTRWRPDTLSVVIGTNFQMKVNIPKYMCANFRAFVMNIFRDMPYYRHTGRPFLNARWRPWTMSIPISYEYIYHKVYVYNFWFTYCKYILQYARLYIPVYYRRPFLNSRWRPVTMSIAMGTRAHINLYI